MYFIIDLPALMRLSLHHSSCLPGDGQVWTLDKGREQLGQMQTFMQWTCRVSFGRDYSLAGLAQISNPYYVQDLG